jgi:hypothetical protein
LLSLCYHKDMSAIHFKAPLLKPNAMVDVGPDPVITLPKAASTKLSSRSTTLVNGIINGRRFFAALEPDGQGSHWFTVDKTLGKAARVAMGDTADIEIDPIPVKEWPEPKVPADLKKAIAADKQIQALWEDITPMARWDWVRWVDTVKLVETRRERPERLCSMLRSGKRRPCCFNRSAQTPPKVAEPL